MIRPPLVPAVEGESVNDYHKRYDQVVARRAQMVAGCRAAEECVIRWMENEPE